MTVEEFALQEYLEIKREHSRLRILALGIMGAVAPISVSLLFSRTLEGSHDTKYVVAAVMLVIASFVYLVLALLYTTLSRRHDHLISYLRTNKNQDYDKYLRAPEARNPLSDWVWPVCNMAIFGFPSLLCLLFGLGLAIYSSTGYLVLAVVPYLIGLLVVFLEWTWDIEERRLVPHMLGWILRGRDPIRRVVVRFFQGHRRIE